MPGKRHTFQVFDLETKIKVNTLAEPTDEKMGHTRNAACPREFVHDGQYFLGAGLGKVNLWNASHSIRAQRLDLGILLFARNFYLRVTVAQMLDLLNPPSPCLQYVHITFVSRIYLTSARSATHTSRTAATTFASLLVPEVQVKKLRFGKAVVRHKPASCGA